MQYINTGMNLKLCNSSIKLYLRVHNSYMRPITHYSGIKLYQTAFGLFRCQDVSCSYRLIQCQDVQGSKCFIRCQNIPGSIRLILVSRYTRQHSPYFGIKMYQAAKTLFCVKIYQATLPYSVSRYTRQHCLFECQETPGNTALFGCQEIPGKTALFGCQETPGNTALFGSQEIPGNTALFGCQETPGNTALFGCQDTQGIRLFSIKFYQAFTSLRVSCFTIHVHKNFIPGNSGIKLTNLNNSQKLKKIIIIPVMSYLRCTSSIVRTQLTLIGPMLYYMHVTGASIAPKQSCVFVKHRSPCNMRENLC